MAIDDLNVAIQAAKDKGISKGVSIPNCDISLSHLFYADDTLFVGEWGRLTLVKYVLENLPNYYLSLFEAPTGVLESLEQIGRRFLWGGSENNKKNHWASWAKVIAPKHKGGLGVGSIHALNVGLMVKWGESPERWGPEVAPLVSRVQGEDPRIYDLNPVWTNLEKVFRDNKASKVIQLDRELRNIRIDNSTITFKGESEWYIDTSATSHLHPNASIFKSVYDNNSNFASSVLVGDGSSMHDFLTRQVLMRCDSSGDLYRVTTLSRQAFVIGTTLCYACQTEKHVRLPFKSSNSSTTFPFELVHSDYKVRLVANRGSPGINCDETFSPVVKPATIRTILSISVTHKYPARHLDVKNVFLHEHLQEIVNMHQPPGFRDPSNPAHVSLLQRSLYVLNYSPLLVMSLLLILMLSGLPARLLDDPLPATASLWDTICYLGPPIVTTPSPDLVRKLSIMVWLTLLPKHVGFVIYYWGCTTLHHATIVYCYNVSMVYMSSNPIQHQRTKYIEIDLHFVRDKVATGHVCVLHVPSSSHVRRLVHVYHLLSTAQFADIFTKGVSRTLFNNTKISLNIRNTPPKQVAGIC
ncbi:hypothetical protein LXL04_029025 [Taraxacum kok-saghyz]